VVAYTIPKNMPHAKPVPAFFVIDTETTGFDPQKSSVVEVGVALFLDGEVVSTFGALVRPRNGLGPECDEALAVNKMNREELASARPFVDVHRELSLWLAQHDIYEPAQSFPVYAFNMQFDARMMTAEYNAIGMQASIPWAGCIAAQAQAKLGPKTKGESRRLGALAERYGIDVGNAHRAVDDAITAGRLCLALGA
jgi:DNA polymerase III epsilon subunit-like protein